MKRKTLILLGLIISLGLFFRLFRLTAFYHFTMDEALIAFRALGLFKYHRPFLIGGISPLQVHLPPYFYYLASLLLLPFNFNPIGWGIWASLLFVLTTLSLYYLTKKLLSQKTAIIACFFNAVLFTPVFFDRHFWPLSLNPLLTITSFLLLTKLNQKSIWPYFGLIFTLLLAFTADPSNIPLILTIVSFLIINRKKISSQFSLTAIISGLGVFFTPLILFDLRHNWQNFSGIEKLFQITSTAQFSFANFINGLLLLPTSLGRFWFSPQTNLVRLYSYCIPYTNARLNQFPFYLTILAILILAWFWLKRFKAHQAVFKSVKLLLAFYLFGITLFSLLGFSIFDHYLTGLLPIFALITAWALSSSFLVLVAPVIITALLLINTFQFSKAHHPYSLKHKNNLISWSQKILLDQPFALDSISKCHQENGLRYLFELTDNPPKISFMDPNFFWLYQKPPAKTIPDKILLITDKKPNLNQPIISQQTFGAMTAIILDNSQKTYEINY